MSLPPNVLRHIYALAHPHVKAKLHVLNRGTLANKNMPAQVQNYTRGTGKHQKRYNEMLKKLRNMETHMKQIVLHDPKTRQKVEKAGVVDLPGALRLFFAFARQMYIDNMRNPDPARVHQRGPFYDNRSRYYGMRVLENLMADYVDYAKPKIGTSGYFELLKYGLRRKSAPRGQATDNQFMDTMTMFCMMKYVLVRNLLYGAGAKRTQPPNLRQAYQNAKESKVILAHWNAPIVKRESAARRVRRRAQRRAAGATA